MVSGKAKLGAAIVAAITVAVAGASLYFTGKKQGAYTLTINARSTTVNMEEPVTFTGKLALNGEGVNGATVNIKYGENTVASTVTAPDGSYLAGLNFNTKGEYIIYSEVENMVKSSTITITVSAAIPVYNLTLIPSTSSIVQGDSITFHGLLSKTVLGATTFINGATVNIYVGTALKASTATGISGGYGDGSYNISVAFNDAGTFSVYAEAPGYAKSQPLTVSTASPRQNLNCLQCGQPLTHITMPYTKCPKCGVMLHVKQ